MRYIKARRISEAVGTVALVLLVLLPLCFSNDDVAPADSEDCDDSSDRTVQSRGCGGNQHQTTERNPGANDSSGGTRRAAQQQWIDRQRRKETWKNVLLQRLWQARRNSSTVGTHILPRHLHSTDLQDFKALLDRTQANNGRADEQDSIARNRVYLPQCSGPPNFTGNWSNGTIFRLYFNVESAAESSGHRSAARETKVLSAYLHLKRKTTPAASSLRATPTVGRTGRQPSEGHARGGQRMANRRRRPLRGVSDNTATDGDNEQLKVIVYLYSRQTKRNRQGITIIETRSVIRTVLFARNSPGWLRINLTPTVDDWVKRPQRNFGIQVTVLNEGGTDELNPGEYFDGFNCTDDQSHPAQVELPLWTLEETLGLSSTNDTVVDLEMNLTQPYLDIITSEVARSKSRLQRDLSAVHSAPSALRNA